MPLTYTQEILLVFSEPNVQNAIPTHIHMKKQRLKQQFGFIQIHSEKWFIVIPLTGTYQSSSIYYRYIRKLCPHVLNYKKHCQGIPTSQFERF